MDSSGRAVARLPFLSMVYVEIGKRSTQEDMSPQHLTACCSDGSVQIGDFELACVGDEPPRIMRVELLQLRAILVVGPVDAQIYAQSKLQPVPRTASAAISSAVHSRAPCAAHSNRADCHVSD